MLPTPNAVPPVSKDQNGNRSSLPLPIVIGFGILLLLFAATLAWSESVYQQGHAADRAFLLGLTADQVASVQWDHQCTLPHTQLATFITAVHTIEDFQVNHDLGAYQGIVRVTLTTGSVHPFRLYQHPRGTVIEFYRGDDDDAYAQKGSIGYKVYGYVVSPTLAQALRCQ